MREHQEHPAVVRVSPRSIPFEGIWSKFTSKFGDIFTTEGPTPTAGAASASVETTMITLKGPIPVTTKTVDTTEVITSFVTVHLTTGVPVTHPTHSTYSTPSSSALDQSSSSTTAGRKTTSSPVVTEKPSDTPTLTLSFESYKPKITPTTTPNSAATSSGGNASHKHAIIGGLSGAIAGLVLIGVLIVFLLRRRRNNREEASDNSSEKGFRPAIVRKWSELTTSNAPSNPVLPVSRGSSAPDLDGGLLRVSLDNWPRPFAQGESWRESMGPRRLQVMNPSPTRPNTPLPRGSSESAGNFLNRQRNALAAVFMGTNRSRASSSVETPRVEVPVPTISVDPALSSEWIAPQVPTPSFRSYSSISSLPVVEQRPPEDPFLTPPDERAEDQQMTPQEKPRRPSIAPLQSAAGAAGRTLTNIGSALNPFRSKSNINIAESLRSISHHSISTFSSAGDPFKLDRPSLRGSNVRTASEVEREPMSKWTVYEGT